MKTDGKIDSTLLFLGTAVFFFVICLFVSEAFFYKDSQLFQVISSLLSGFGGALLAKVKTGPSDPTTTTTVTVPPMVTRTETKSDG